MNLAEWRSARRRLLTLPSGLEVKIQRVDVQTLLFEGQVPKPLLGMIAGLQGDGLDIDFSDASKIQDNIAKLPELVVIYNVVVKAAIVDPPAFDDDDYARLQDAAKAEYAASHIRVDELPIDDRVKIFEEATAGAKAIAPFPPTDGGSDAAGRGGAEIPPAPESVPAD